MKIIKLWHVLKFITNEKNCQDEINKYLGESANNSLAINNNNEFTNYFYSSSIEEDFKYIKLLSILEINKCIDTCREYYELKDREDMFVGLMEYNNLGNNAILN